MRDFGYWVRRIGAAGSAVLLSAVLGGCTGWPGGGPASGTTTGGAAARLRGRRAASRGTCRPRRCWW